MDTIREWATALCVTLVGGAIFKMLTPNGSMEKTIRFVIGLFFTAAVIMPFFSGNIRFEFPTVAEGGEYQNEELEETVDAGIKTLIERSVNKQITQLLNSNSISAQKVGSSINISQDGSISIECVEIYLSGQYEAVDEDIRKIIKKELNIEPDIIYEE